MNHNSKTVKEELELYQAIFDVYPNAINEYYSISLRRKTHRTVDPEAKLDSLVVDSRSDAEPMIAPASGIKIDDWRVCVQRPDTRYIPIHSLLCALREYEPETHAKILSTLIEMQDAKALLDSKDPLVVEKGVRYLELLKENI